jgi:hypothetical protein
MTVSPENRTPQQISVHRHSLGNLFNATLLAGGLVGIWGSVAWLAFSVIAKHHWLREGTAAKRAVAVSHRCVKFLDPFEKCHLTRRLFQQQCVEDLTSEKPSRS